MSEDRNSEPEPDPDRPLSLAHAIRIFFPMGGMTVSGLRKERDRGSLTVYRMAGRDYTTINALREMMERCRVTPLRPSSPDREGQIASRRHNLDIEGSRVELRATLERLKREGKERSKAEAAAAALDHIAKPRSRRQKTTKP